MVNANLSVQTEVINREKSKYDVSSPIDREKSQELVDQVHDVYMRRWGEFFDDSRREVCSLSIKNPIYKNRDGLKNATNPTKKGIGAISSYITRNSIGVDAYTEHVDGVSLIKLYPFKAGFDRFSKNDIDKMISIFKSRFSGDYQQTREFLEKYYFQNIHSHEAAHVAQDDEIPHWLKEMGARYYQVECIKSIYGVNEMQLADAKIAHMFYEQLLTEYDEDVHKYFFGSDISNTVKRKIRMKSFIYLIKTVANEIAKV